MRGAWEELERRNSGYDENTLHLWVRHPKINTYINKIFAVLPTNVESASALHFCVCHPPFWDWLPSRALWCLGCPNATISKQSLPYCLALFLSFSLTFITMHFTSLFIYSLRQWRGGPQGQIMLSVPRKAVF